MGSNASDWITALALDANGSIVAPGLGWGPGGIYVGIARFLTDGAIDDSFGDGGVIFRHPRPASYCCDWNVRGVAVMNDGRIVVGGQWGESLMVTRFHSNGSLDESFGDGGTVVIRFDDPISSLTGAGDIALSRDGIVVAGGAGGSFVAARLDDSGHLDPSFGEGGKVADLYPDDPALEAASAVEVDAQGRVVLGGLHEREEYVSEIVRLNPDGSVDESFGTDGRVLTQGGRISGGPPRTLLIQPDGAIVISYIVEGEDFDFGLWRFLSNGMIDESFGTNGFVATDFVGRSDIPSGIGMACDGGLVAAGYSYDLGLPEYDYDFALSLYHSDGTLNEAFGVGGIALTDFAGGTDYANAMVVQPDGRALLGGASLIGNEESFALARYLTCPEDG